MKTTTETPAFDQPEAVTGADTLFGGDMARLLPPLTLISEECKRDRGKFSKLVSRWFFQGLPATTKFLPREGIEEKAALRHIKAVLGSFAPKHEHKTAAVAWLLDKWFSEIVLPETEI